MHKYLLASKTIQWGLKKIFTWLHRSYLHHLGSFVAVFGLSSWKYTGLVALRMWAASFPIRGGTHTHALRGGFLTTDRQDKSHIWWVLRKGIHGHGHLGNN